MRYLLVTSAPGRRLSPTTFATETAFADHLRAMKQALSPRFDEMVVAMPHLSEAQYRKNLSQLSVLDEEKEAIHLECLFPAGASTTTFVRQLPRIAIKLAQLVRAADLVHSHPDHEIWRPVMSMTSAFAVAMGKKLIAINDMDNRADAVMNHRLGRWSTKSYLICRYVYDPIRDLQQRAYVKAADLMLFKEPQQVKDYGRGAPHVRLFLDPNFHASYIISDDQIAPKIRELEDPTVPLRLLYFGRLVAYKGVDKMIEAVAVARSLGAHLTFDIMGTGEDEPRLRRLVEQHGIGDIVRWVAPRPYGPSFFEVLRERHLLLACPLSGDTPRSAWDAMASGMPILAFDTPFYKGMGEYTGAVDVVPWPKVEKLANRLQEIAAQKSQLVPQVIRATSAARSNTGEEWLRRRVEWIEELFDKPLAAKRTPGPASPSG